MESDQIIPRGANEAAEIKWRFLLPGTSGPRLKVLPSRAYTRLGVPSDAREGELAGGEMSGETAHLASGVICDIYSVFRSGLLDQWRL